MRAGLIAKKIGMTSMFNEKGQRYPLTFLKIEDCQVVGHKTLENDGYAALIVGARNVKISKISKPVRRLFTNAKVEPKAHLKEFRIIEDNFIDIGVSLTVNHFVIGQFVDVTGVTIGKGFAGCMKRHNFRGLEASHGVSISHRSHGSTGGRQDPGRVFKNKKMAGHMGSKKSTIQNLTIIAIDEEQQIVMVKGSVPGHKGSLVYIKDAIKKSVMSI
ncbi:50S ribosomal protein L3 [Candidatus Trichorickettsia mobilis]|uniref:Large ribosomal subunit protein uL3 n=1 Tax=Candidatus Trichorickettsia mobilis TaxID=1346319 RepID=A0ABZ0USF1_9RICK|nr:50S ribosomal protein L3 [Candidatus Trichorickettsia mobilis]WPY00541.1 50S ribosomal protein L3 [Candidatus Trichorickettsia mobilis]